MHVQPLEKIVVETGENPRTSIIWLHGLGADGHDFEPIVPELGLADDLPVRFIFPSAPPIPVTLNGGYIMPAWYDIRQSDFGIEHDAAGVARSARQIQMLIEQQQMRGIVPERVILAGFSQGGAMALYCGLRQPKPLAGIMALSAYLLLPGNMEAEIKKDTRSMPIFMAHGVKDPVVPVALGDTAHRRLEDLGYAVSWHTYPMEHQVCPEEISEVGRWISDILHQECCQT